MLFKSCPLIRLSKVESPSIRTFVFVHAFQTSTPSHAYVYLADANDRWVSVQGAEFEPKAAKVQPGSEDLCFITEHPIEGVLKSWREAGIEVSDIVVLVINLHCPSCLGFGCFLAGIYTESKT